MPPAIGVEKQAQAVGETGLDVQIHESRPAGYARVGVGHAQRRALLRGQDVLDIRGALERVHDRTLGGPRVSKYVADTLGAEDLHEGVFA